MNMDALMAQASVLQDKVAAAQDKLGKTHVKGIADAGACIIDMTCKYDLVNITIRQDVLSRGADAVAQLVAAAYNDAKSKADVTIDRVMGDATAGLPIGQ